MSITIEPTAASSSSKVPDAVAESNYAAIRDVLVGLKADERGYRPTMCFKLKDNVKLPAGWDWAAVINTILDDDECITVPIREIHVPDRAMKGYELAKRIYYKEAQGRKVTRALRQYIVDTHTLLEEEESKAEDEDEEAEEANEKDVGDDDKNKEDEDDDIDEDENEDEDEDEEENEDEDDEDDTATAKKDNAGKFWESSAVEVKPKRQRQLKTAPTKSKSSASNGGDNVRIVQDSIE